MSQSIAVAGPRQRPEAPGAASQAGKAYLYAIVPAEPERRFEGLGIDDAGLHTVTEGRVSAVVSGLVQPKLRPERRHIAAHQRVLKQVMAETSLLPMSFGIVAESPEAVRRILARNQAALLEGLRRVTGKIEMGLRVVWDVPNIFEYFVNTHSELRAVRDRLFGGAREPTQEEKIEVGRMFDRQLQEDRDSHAERVEAVLARYCAEIKRTKCRSEREVMNLACLIRKADQEAFEGSVFGVAQLFDNSYAFDYSGPWPPYNFAEVDLKV